MRRGVTLIELLLALVLLGLLSLIALPRLAALVASLALRQEAAALVEAVDQARTTAIRLGGISTLTLDDTLYLVRAGVAPDTAPTWQREGPGHRGVRLSGGGGPVQFGAAGLAVGVANRTFTLSRAGATRSVVLSRLGRITP